MTDNIDYQFHLKDIRNMMVLILKSDVTNPILLDAFVEACEEVKGREGVIHYFLQECLYRMVRMGKNANHLVEAINRVFIETERYYFSGFLEDMGNFITLYTEEECKEEHYGFDWIVVGLYKGKIKEEYGKGY